MKFLNRKVAEFCLSHQENLRYVRENLGLNLRIYESLCETNSDAVRICNWLKNQELIHDYFVRNGFAFMVENEGDKPRKVKHPNVLRNTFPEIANDFDDVS